MNRSSSKVSLALALLILAGACNKGVGGASSASGGRDVGTVTRGDLIQKVTIAGTVVPERRTVILPPYDGYIKKMYVKVGERVKAGDPVVSIVQTLAGEAESYPVRAPFSGNVVQVLHQDGEYVEAKGDGNILLRIDDLSRLYVNADVAEMDIPKIRVGQEVLVKASAILDHSYKGVIREIFLAAREKKEWSRTGDKVEFPVRIEITERDPAILTGMSALVDVIANKREKVLLLKHEYIQKKGDDYFAVLVDGTRRKLKVGLQNEEAFEILDGVSEGDRAKQTDFMSAAEENSGGT